MKSDYRNLKYALRKRVVCVFLASTVFLLMGCRQSNSVIRERVVQVPVIKTEQVWKYKLDTLYRYETDSILIETIVHDTTIEQHIEMKPLYITVRDTIFDAKTERAKKQNKWLKEENKRLKKADEKANKPSTGWLIAYAFGTAVVIGWLARKRD